MKSPIIMITGTLLTVAVFILLSKHDVTARLPYGIISRIFKKKEKLLVLVIFN